MAVTMLPSLPQVAAFRASANPHGSHTSQGHVAAATATSANFSFHQMLPQPVPPTPMMAVTMQPMYRPSEANAVVQTATSSTTMPCCVTGCVKYAQYNRMCMAHIAEGYQLPPPQQHTIITAPLQQSPALGEQELRRALMQASLSKQRPLPSLAIEKSPVNMFNLQKLMIPDAISQHQTLLFPSRMDEERDIPSVPSTPSSYCSDGEIHSIPGSTNSRKKRAIRKKCKIIGCHSFVKTKGLCKRHGGGVRCGVDNCPNSAKRGGFCIRHGGGRCKVEGCKSGERRGGMCAFHIRLLASNGSLDSGFTNGHPLNGGFQVSSSS